MIAEVNGTLAHASGQQGPLTDFLLIWMGFGSGTKKPLIYGNTTATHSPERDARALQHRAHTVAMAGCTSAPPWLGTGCSSRHRTSNTVQTGTQWLGTAPASSHS